LANGELAINITDGKLYYKDNGGVVQVIATKGAGTIGGSTTQIQYNNSGALAGNAAMTFNSATSTTTLTTLNLTNALGATYGGTAQSAYAQGDILYASATNTLSKLSVGTVNYILTSSGSVPQWSAPTSIVVQTANNLAGGAAGSVPYQSAVDTTTFLAIGAANRVMTSSGTAPQWVTSLTGLTGVSSSSITNTSLTAGRVVYSSTAGLETDSANLTFNGTTLSTAGLSNTGFSTLVKTLTLGDSNFNGTAVFAPATPAKMYFGTGTATDVTSAASATNVAGAVVAMGITPIAATNASVTYTNASTLYIAGAPSAGTNITITNPYALYVAAGNSFLGGNLLFTDNTYTIGANGATRPASGWFSRTVTSGQGTGQNWQFLAVDYAQGTGGGYADGIYTNSIKAGTYQGFGFDTQYSNSGSWVASQTSASIIDGYQGNFRFFGRNDLTAGTAYTPALRFTVGPTGLASLWTAVAADPGITNSLTIGRSSLDATYGGYIGLRAISADQRQGLFLRSTGSLTHVALYNIDFMPNSSSVPLGADTNLAMRINANKAVSIGGSTTDTYPLEIYASGSSSTSKNMLNIYYGAAGSAEPTIQFQTANGGIGKLGFITAGASAGQFQLYTADGSTYVTRYVVDNTGVQTWGNAGSSSNGTRMKLDANGLAVGYNASTSSQATLVVGSTSTSDYNGILINRGAVGAASTIQTGLWNELNGIGSGETLTMRTPNGYKWQNYNGVTEWMRLDGSTGYLLIGTASNEARLTVSGGAFFGQLSPKTRYVQIGTTGFTTMRYDDNGYGVLTLQNLGVTATQQGYRIIGQFSNDGTNAYNAGYIMFVTEGLYTGTTSTQDSGIAFATAIDGVNGERVRITSGGSVVIGSNAAQSNYGLLQVLQPSDGTQSSLGFIGTDNATISSKYSLVFQIDSATGQTGRAYTWKHNGKGYSDGDQLMALNADTNQLQVGTTQAFTDAYAGTTYPGVAAANGLAAMGLGNSGATSRLTRSTGVNINTTYTVKVYPSDGSVACMDIRVAVYCSAGTGYANSMFCYGGHTGAYNITTPFNVYSGNTTVSAATVVGSAVQFTVTIANAGNSGGLTVMVDDAGQSAGKTAFITIT
jgi:hypothetical protein